MTRLKCSDTGEWIDLGKDISTSGEGIIYRTSKAGFLAKIYHTITQEKIDKLQVMVKNPPADPTRSQNHVSIAWPKCLLQDSYGKSLGFLMPAIGKGQTLINVYNPSAREKNAPGFNWLYLHTTAMNIASIVQAIHNNNYVVGDLKPANLLVTSNAYVSIIDTDSFQIADRQTLKIYCCPVVSQEYTPREMFDKDPEKVYRSEFQDRFALAVIIWHLLFGNHPFSGDFSGNGNQLNIDQLIKEGWWMYGSSPQLRPNPGSIPLNIIHPELQQLFRKCFNDGHNKPDARASAADWQKALRQAISELTQCSVERGHHYAKSYGKCYWCERKRQLGYDMFASPSGTPKPPVSPGRNTIPIKPSVPPVKPGAFPINPLPIKHPQLADKIKTLLGAGAILLILSAIALPSFFNQANKAKQSEAKQYVGSMNRAQQALFAEKASFVSNISDLGLGIKSETTNYKYQISKQLNDSVVVAVGEPKISGIKGYVGIVVASKKDSTSTLFCEQSQASTSFPNLSTIVTTTSQGDNIVKCPAGYQAPASYPQFLNINLSQKSSSNVLNLDLQSKMTPEQTIKNFYAFTTKDNKAAGKAFTTEDFKRKYPSIEKNNQKKWVSKFNFIQVTQMNPIEKLPTRAKMTVWLLYSFKDGSPKACEYRDFTLVLNNNNFLIDDIGEATQIPCP